MSKIRIGEAVAGMVLAADVELGGRVLLSRGVELGENVLERLRRMGVEELDILAAGRLAEEDIPDEALSEAVEHVRSYFVYVDPDDPAMLESFRMATLRTARRIAAGWRPPTEDERLARNLEHLKDIFYAGEFGPQDLVSHEMELESFPDIYFRIKQVLDQPASSAQAIAEVVGTDVNLSAKLLRLVNSPFYGFASTIDSIARAIAIVGAKELTTLALGISAITFFKDIPPELADMRLFWRHSVSVGIFAKILAAKARLHNPERLFTAGLLHDVGRLVLFKKVPYASVQTLLFARENLLPVSEAEKDVLGFSHAEVGAQLLRAWNFPHSLEDLVGNHHTPSRSDTPGEAALIQAADSLANALEIAEGGLYVVPGMEAGAWGRTGLDPKCVGPAMEEYDRQADEIIGVFLG